MFPIIDIPFVTWIDFRLRILMRIITQCEQCEYIALINRGWHQIIVITCNFGRIVTKLAVVVDLIDRPRSPLLLLPVSMFVFAMAFSDNASICLTYGSFIADVEVRMHINLRQSRFKLLLITCKLS